MTTPVAQTENSVEILLPAVGVGKAVLVVLSVMFLLSCLVFPNELDVMFVVERDVFILPSVRYHVIIEQSRVLVGVELEAPRLVRTGVVALDECDHRCGLTVNYANAMVQLLLRVVQLNRSILKQ